MKIRIEISSGNMSYVMDKDVAIDVEPQVIIEAIESLLTAHEVDLNYIGCSACDNFDVPAYEEPCYSCMLEGSNTEDGKYSKFTRKTY